MEDAGERSGDPSVVKSMDSQQICVPVLAPDVK